jgi:hypothetical protein
LLFYFENGCKAKNSKNHFINVKSLVFLKKRVYKCERIPCIILSLKSAF